jgi:SAM-dependent methyltransferase
VLHNARNSLRDEEKQETPILQSVAPLRNILEGSKMNSEEVLKSALQCRALMGQTLLDDNGFASWGREGGEERHYWQYSWDEFKKFIRGQKGFREADSWAYEFDGKKPVHTVLRQMRLEGSADSKVLFLSLMESGFRREEEQCTQEQYDQLMAGSHPLANFSMPGRGNINHRRIFHNQFSNWLRIAGVIDQTPYDSIHQTGMYRFSGRKTHNMFIRDVLEYRNGKNKSIPIIDGRRILSLGAGSGHDELKMVQAGAKQVDMFEVSEHMVNQMQGIRRGLSRSKRRKFVAPSIPIDMFEGLQVASQKNEKWDTVYAHSSVHYYDDERLYQLLGLISNVLKDGGHFCLAVKEPRVLFDRDDNGIVLLDDQDEYAATPNDSTSAIVRQRIRLCHDGIIRVFRSRDVWVKILEESGFEVSKSVAESVENYEVMGDKQRFSYLIAKKHKGVH